MTPHRCETVGGDVLDAHLRNDTQVVPYGFYPRSVRSRRAGACSRRFAVCDGVIFLKHLIRPRLRSATFPSRGRLSSLCETVGDDVAKRHER